MINIGKIKQTAKEKGIKLSYITDRLGLKKPYFSDVEKGKTSISNERLVLIAEILGTTPEYLRDETDEKNSLDDPETAEIREILDYINADERREILRHVRALRDAHKKEH